MCSFPSPSSPPIFLPHARLPHDRRVPSQHPLPISPSRFGGASAMHPRCTAARRYTCTPQLRICVYRERKRNREGERPLHPGGRESLVRGGSRITRSRKRVGGRGGRGKIRSHSRPRPCRDKIGDILFPRSASFRTDAYANRVKHMLVRKPDSEHARETFVSPFEIRR